MNRSGDAVALLGRYYDIAGSDMLVVSMTSICVRRLPRPASAGPPARKRDAVHRERIGTEFPRLRLGVGSRRREADLADNVLSKFERDEQDALEALITGRRCRRDVRVDASPG